MKTGPNHSDSSQRGNDEGQSGHRNASTDSFIQERLSDEAWALAGQRPELLRDLLKPISLNHSAEAERLIRKQLPLDRDLQQGNRDEYRFVAMWIEQYRNVFGLDQAKALAKEIMAKYPRRYALKEEIGRVLK